MTPQRLELQKHLESDVLAGLCRDTKPKSPQRQGSKIRLPRQHARSDAATSLAERTEIPELKENHHDVGDPHQREIRWKDTSSCRNPRHKPNQLSGWCPVSGGLAGAIAWCTGDPFGMN